MFKKQRVEQQEETWVSWQAVMMKSSPALRGVFQLAVKGRWAYFLNFAAKRTVFFGIVCTLIIRLSQTVAGASTPFGNLVPDNDFENTSGQAGNSWSVGETKGVRIVTDQISRAPRGIEMSIVVDPEDTANHVLKLETRGDGKKFGFAFSEPFRLLAGFQYEFSIRYRGLVGADGQSARGARLIFDLFCGPAIIMRQEVLSSSVGWSSLTNQFTVPATGGTTAVHIALNGEEGAPPMAAWLDNVAVTPLDPVLPNSDFENRSLGKPVGWLPVGTAKTSWVTDTAHGGRASLSVADAGDGDLSGWSTEIPVRPDRSYSFSAWVKTGILNAHGFVGGAAVSVQFVDAIGQPVGKPIVSSAMGGGQDWTQVSTPLAQAPSGAQTAKLTLGMSFCDGTAWFDDVSLLVREVLSAESIRVQRQPVPSTEVKYAANLLVNGDVEAGENNRPRGWTYVGKGTADWTTAELETMKQLGRPLFKNGRGQGEWARDVTYSGNGALLNISVDPPLSGGMWHGRNPVDGYWLSDPMAVEPGKNYIASAWIKPGARISSAWIGPLELQFFDKAGKQVNSTVRRSVVGEAASGAWNYWISPVGTAPSGAATMKLRFGQEYSQSYGGWGHTYADNLAVWELPTSAEVAPVNTAFVRAWFSEITSQLKPPYQPSPSDASEYETLWMRLKNSTAGNIIRDPHIPFHSTISVFNILGEDRDLSLVLTRYDWLGNKADPVKKSFKVLGNSATEFDVDVPALGSFGAFYLQLQVLEGKAVVGTGAGRYGVLPALDRPRSAANFWGVTTLCNGDEKFSEELGFMLKTAGFGLTWMPITYEPTDESIAMRAAEIKPRIDWYRSLGIRTILRLSPHFIRPISISSYEAAGRKIGELFKDQVAAIGNWGVEQVNTKSGFRGSGADRITDEECDTVLGAQYDGIKSVAPNESVLIGNIATDFEAKTIHRLYEKPAVGKFDGAIINAYLQIDEVVGNAIKEFDIHGDKNKDIWVEENSDQRSPFEGGSRRYGEGEGARNMVRRWLGLVSRNWPRVKAVTMWGFVTQNEEDINMVTPQLQPRPHFAAFAVMADALADANFVANRSRNGTSIFEWTRGGETLFTAWADSGTHEINLRLSAPSLINMDLMGNRTEVIPSGGVATLKVGGEPCYLFGQGEIKIDP